MQRQCLRSQGFVALLMSCIFAFAAIASFSHQAMAAESGQSSYLKGYQDFLSGALPPESGLYLRNDVLYYDGTVNRTVIGGRVAVSLHEQLVANVTALTYVTPLEILGGTFVMSATVPFEYLDVTAGLQGGRFGTSTSKDRFSLGDAFFTPALIGWSSGNFHWNAGFSFAVPSGVYHNGSLNNTSLNRWAFMPQSAITYLDLKTGWNASAALIYVASTENPATHYQTGDIVDVDFSAGRYLSKTLQVGLVGYYEQQITNDSGSGALLGPNKLRVWALGPGATYSFMLGETPITATAKWTHEFAAQNTFEGQTFTLAAALKF